MACLPELQLQAINETVRKFEQCEFRPEEFHHRDHLTVIACYLEQMPVRQALAHMRAALQRFTAHHNRKGYNETITCFWVAEVARAIATQPADLPLAALLERVHLALGDKDLVFRHYTRERLLSDDAKQRWVEPDLRASK